MPTIELIETVIPTYISTLFVLIIGLCVGSFLNVAIYRIEAGVLERKNRIFNIAMPPSHCPNCKHNLEWYDNIPILSWILLKGECRHCKINIPSKYPLVELITGLLFATAWLITQNVGVWLIIIYGASSILPIIWWLVHKKQWHTFMYTWAFINISCLGLLYIWIQN